MTTAHTASPHAMPACDTTATQHASALWPTPQAQAPRTRIKICGLTREEDVDAAVQAGADAVGFVLYPRSPRAVTVDQAVALAGRLPPFVTPVLLLVNATPELAATAVQAVPHATLQFHGDESPEDCATAAAIAGTPRPYLRAARIPLGPAGRDFDLPAYARRFAGASAILLDAHVDGYGGAGQSFDWSLLHTRIDTNLVLSGGLTPDNVGDGIHRLRPLCRSLAVDISSGVEAVAADGSTLKGIKDPGKIRRFIAAVRHADDIVDPIVPPSFRK